MTEIYLREPDYADATAFIEASLQSQGLHYPWTQAPTVLEDFHAYVTRYKQPNNKSYLVITPTHEIAGVFNLSEIVRGCFQNAYLGYYAFAPHAGKGYMSRGLKLVLAEAFNLLALHRIEANIQPENKSSIHLVEKNGFRKEGFSPRYLKINGKWCDHERWAITIEDRKKE